MKNISYILIFCYSILILAPYHVFSQDETIRILKIKDDRFATDVGSIHGVKKDSIYLINQKNVIIGKAKVIIVKEKMCAMKLISLQPGKQIQVGDQLILNMGFIEDNNSDFDNILNEVEEQPDSIASMNQNINFYNEGKLAADNEYSGSGAGAGGLLCGLSLGLIGWGLGYAVVSSSTPEVPPQHLTNLDSNQQLQFSMGYKERAKNVRNHSFNSGAFTGTILAALTYAIIFSTQKN
ncbi:hypothetical protein JXQ31_12415 [candidate division KSB1 bacterium]|nr:hypothetical protein [candidate division KSB1 bacterium]